jgi:hypothetical protein
MVIRWSSTRLRLPRTGASSPQTRHLFDVIEPGSSAQAIATIPEFFWELSLGIYLIVKGFRSSSAILVIPESPSVVPATSAV